MRLLSSTFLPVTLSAGGSASRSLQTDLVLGALEQALWLRQRKDTEDLIHPSDRGSQYLSTRYSDRLEEANILPSVGSVAILMIMPWRKPSMAFTKPK
jgi:hypothetical protein